MVLPIASLFGDERGEKDEVESQVILSYEVLKFIMHHSFISFGKNSRSH